MRVVIEVNTLKVLENNTVNTRIFGKEVLGIC